MIATLLQKEWLELRGQRALIFSVTLLPVFLTVFPLIGFIAAGSAPTRGNLPPGGEAGPFGSNPLLAGLNPRELAQAVVGQQVSTIYVLMCLIIPSIIAAYSIVGEKTNRTLEPLLATPIKTSQLLLGKSLTALIPAVVLTWLASGVFATTVALTSVSPRVFQAVITPGWVALILLDSPLMALIAIAVMVIISSRVNDPRTAQQFSGWVVGPFFVFFFGQLSGVLVFSPSLALGIAVILAALAVVTMRLATRLFQREAILTRWT